MGTTPGETPSRKDATPVNHDRGDDESEGLGALTPPPRTRSPRGHPPESGNRADESAELIDPIRLGDTVRRLRRQQGLTLRRLADAAISPSRGTPLDPSYVSLVERGLRVPTVDAVSALGRGLGVPGMFLLTLAIPVSTTPSWIPERGDGLTGDGPPDQSPVEETNELFDRLLLRQQELIEDWLFGEGARSEADPRDEGGGSRDGGNVAGG